ncbi:MAG: tetratricopeptide repeat protein [Candidatus Melainabacteria bacterium]|nr:tetratricopeptide repeat protein [Candidatus Melainabacteria bacterium]
MEKLNLKNAVAFGNDAFTRLKSAEALYEELVERLYALGEDVAGKIESPERVANALIKAAHAHVGRHNGYRLAEKALVTAYRIVAKVAPEDNARIIAIYKLLGHVCCRQGKHREAMKYNALALVLQVNPQPISLRTGQ